MSENILVTGGAGFIGSHLVKKLLSDNHVVSCIDNFNDFYNPTFKENNIKKASKNDNFNLIRGDILDVELLQKVFRGKVTKIKPDIIIHLAAMAGVRPSLVSPSEYIDVDIKGTLNLLEMSKKYGIKKFIFASSSSVYGVNDKIPFSEDDRLSGQISPYAAAKRSAELYCKTYNHLYGIPVIILRLFTVYGPRQRPDMAIRKFIRLIYESKPIPVYGDGTSRRDYTYIDDCVVGFRKSIDLKSDFEIINIGSGKTVSLSELIEIIDRHIEKKVIIEKLDNQPGDVPITCADIKKAAMLLKYNPQVSMEEGIKRFISWYKERI